MNEQPLSNDVLLIEALIKKSIHVPEVSKAVSNNLLVRILETIPTAPPIAMSSALKFLETALRLYPGPSGMIRTSTQKFILSFIDLTDELMLRKSAKCLQLMQQVRGSASHGSTHRESWRELHLQLIGSIHGIFDIIYKDIEATLKTPVPENRLKVDQLILKDESITRVSQLVTRLRNLCTMLEVVLM